MFRRQSNHEKFFNNEQPGLPHILEVLDKVDHIPVPDERNEYINQKVSVFILLKYYSLVDAGWRVMFNKMANFNWLGKVRKTKLYHNTEDVINRFIQHFSIDNQ